MTSRSNKKIRSSLKKTTSVYNINRIPTKIESTKVSKNVTKFRVKSEHFEPFTILVDSHTKEILNNDHSLLGTVKKSTQKASSIKNGTVVVPIKKYRK